MGNFPIFVHPDCGDALEGCDFRKFLRGQNYTQKSVIATPGYFSIDLESGIRAEMTATEHVALYRFSFESVPGHGKLHPVIQADGSDLLNSFGLRSMYVDASTGRMKGEGVFRPSFGQGSYQAYFCADFKGVQLSDVGAFNETVLPEVNEAVSSHDYDGPLQGVYARFKDVKHGDHIMTRIGLSWLSTSRACENGEHEVSDWDFERVHKEAVQAWRTKLEPIQVSTKDVSKKHLRNFWSGVYRAFLNPQDYTSENQLWNSTEPYYDSWYCIWDTFRGVHPFLTLVDPISQSRMVRSLIDIFKHAGYLPEASIVHSPRVT